MQAIHWNEAQEKKARRNAVIAVLLALALIFVLIWIWVVVRDTIPPQGEERYEVVGSVDFGDNSQGSQNVNTMAPSAANASPTPPNPNPRPVQPQQQVQNVVTRDRPSPVSAATEQTTQTVSQPTDRVDNPLTFDASPGGANDGNSGNFGNEGTPGAPLSNGNGLMWGDGEYGARGRRLLNQFQRPIYDVNEEGSITFELSVLPSGEVSDVKVIRQCFCPNMQRRSIENLRRLRFSRINHNTVQKIRVTLNFAQD